MTFLNSYVYIYIHILNYSYMIHDIWHMLSIDASWVSPRRWGPAEWVSSGSARWIRSWRHPNLPCLADVHPKDGALEIAFECFWPVQIVEIRLDSFGHGKPWQTTAKHEKPWETTRPFRFCSVMDPPDLPLMIRPAQIDLSVGVGEIRTRLGHSIRKRLIFIWRKPLQSLYIGEHSTVAMANLTCPTFFLAD